MFEPFAYPFMQRALAGGVLVAMLTGYFGPFIVQRGLGFLGSGLAHAAFGGVALGLLLGLDPLYVAIPFTMLVAWAIMWVRGRGGLGADTAVGIFFSVSMALGIVFLTLKQGYTGDAFTYLFGSILYVNRGDLIVAVGLLLACLLLWPLWGKWAYATFDRDLARADGLPVQNHDYLIAMFLAAIIVVALKLVGMVLIAAFLVLPAATARLLAPTFAVMTWLSVALGVFSVVAGLTGSYYASLPSGPFIILLQAALFFLALAFRTIAPARD